MFGSSSKLLIYWEGGDITNPFCLRALQKYPNLSKLLWCGVWWFVFSNWCANRESQPRNNPTTAELAVFHFCPPGTSACSLHDSPLISHHINKTFRKPFILLVFYSHHSHCHVDTDHTRQPSLISSTSLWGWEIASNTDVMLLCIHSISPHMDGHKCVCDTSQADAANGNKSPNHLHRGLMASTWQQQTPSLKC